MILATIAPYVRHREEIASHPLVGGLRFNTIMPVGEEKTEVLDGLKRIANGKRLWIDLKTRQLRITEFSYLPFAYVTINQKIEVDTPCEIHFKDCVSEIARVVDGNKLILSKRPARVVGAGEPVNILDPSLSIRDFLSENDKAYVKAAKALGIHTYMLSFVEAESDIEELIAEDPEAEVIAKIESTKGLEFVRKEYGQIKNRVRLMAARDDLFINMGYAKPRILGALAEIIKADPRAFAASRILTSLEGSEDVSMGDISDLALCSMLGYSRFLLSDGLCFSENGFSKAVKTLSLLIPEIEALTGRSFAE